MKQQAIAKLISYGMSNKEAEAEFNDRVNYFMRGTLHTVGAKLYAIECAINDILYNEHDYDEHYYNMLDMMHN